MGFFFVGCIVKTQNFDIFQKDFTGRNFEGVFYCIW